MVIWIATEPAFTETELALRWNVSAKTLQRWRSEGVGPPYLKLSKAVRYPVDEIAAYEQANRQGMPNDAALPPLTAAQTPIRVGRQSKKLGSDSNYWRRGWGEGIIGI